MAKRKMTKSTKTIIGLLAAALLIALIPLVALPNAEFGGADGNASELVEEISGEEFTPWHTPLIEKALGGELPGELESLLFCVQTGIGIGVIAFIMGRMMERNKRTKQDDEK